MNLTLLWNVESFYAFHRKYSHDSLNIESILHAGIFCLTAVSHDVVRKGVALELRTNAVDRTPLARGKRRKVTASLCVVFPIQRRKREKRLRIERRRI